MERWIRDRSERWEGGGLKDRPTCELCGKPVRISSEDHEREEVLCAHCEFELRVRQDADQEAAWSG